MASRLSPARFNLTSKDRFRLAAWSGVPGMKRSAVNVPLPIRERSAVPSMTSPLISPLSVNGIFLPPNGRLHDSVTVFPDTLPVNSNSPASPEAEPCSRFPFW